MWKEGQKFLRRVSLCESHCPKFSVKYSQIDQACHSENSRLNFLLLKFIQAFLMITYLWFEIEQKLKNFKSSFNIFFSFQNLFNFAISLTIKGVMFLWKKVSFLVNTFYYLIISIDQIRNKIFADLKVKSKYF